MCIYIPSLLCLLTHKLNTLYWHSSRGKSCIGKIFSLLFGNLASPLMPYSNSTRVYGNWDGPTYSVHSNFPAKLL